MQSWLECISGIFFLILLLGLPAALRRRRTHRQQIARQRLELVLLPKESIRIICPQKGGRWILTSRRVLVETAQGFTAVPIQSIQKVRGITADGRKTSLPEKMAALTIPGESPLTLRNTCPEFPEFVRYLQKRTEKKPKKRGKPS